MSSELINIVVYDYDGTVDSWLSLTIDIYNTTDSIPEVTTGIMSYNATVKRYQYNFTNFDEWKEYICNVDCWVSALTRYIWFWLGSNLMKEEHTKLGKSLTRNEFIALQNP